jgi:hypothetical protein
MFSATGMRRRKKTGAQGAAKGFDVQLMKHINETY